MISRSCVHRQPIRGGGFLRLLSLILIFAITLIIADGCSKKGENPPPAITIKDGARYFPIQQGNIWYCWYYEGGQGIRKLDGDTTINGVLCQRLLNNGKTDEAWTLTTAKFSQHLLGGSRWFEPPLEIPLDLEKDKPFVLVSQPHYLVGDSSQLKLVKATLTFSGYVTREILDVTVDSCLQIDYAIREFEVIDGDTVWGALISYSEFYGIGLGLIDDGDKALDSAFISGIKRP